MLSLTHIMDCYLLKECGFVFSTHSPPKVSDVILCFHEMLVLVSYISVFETFRF